MARYFKDLTEKELVYISFEFGLEVEVNGKPGVITCLHRIGPSFPNNDDIEDISDFTVLYNSGTHEVISFNTPSIKIK